MLKKIAVTGANGFIGKALIALLAEKGYEVFALVHRMPSDEIPGVNYQLFELGKNLDQVASLYIDTLIHLAFDFKGNQNGEDRNLKTANAIQQLNIPQIIFVSSFAAVTPVTDSYYGRCKSEMEKVFQNDLIIRPGLVLGNGGLFGRMNAQLKKNRITPLINGGLQMIYTIALNDLLETILLGITTSSKGVWNIAYPEPTSYRNLTSLIAAKLGVHPIFIPVPVFVVIAAIEVLRFFNKPLITKDNLKGLLTEKSIDTKIDMQALRVQWKNAEESISLLNS